MASDTITITGDSSELSTAIEAAVDFLNCSPERVNAFVDLLNDTGNLVCIESRTAAGTVHISFKPTQRFLDVLAACRAGD